MVCRSACTSHCLTNSVLCGSGDLVDLQRRLALTHARTMTYYAFIHEQDIIVDERGRRTLHIASSTIYKKSSARARFLPRISPS